MGADQAQIGLFAPLPMIHACRKVLHDIYKTDDLAPAVPSSLAKVAEAVRKLGLRRGWAARRLGLRGD